MLRHTLSAALSLLLLFTLLSAAAIAISATQPPNPALAGFARCDYGGWCWFGIRPGVTTVREADQLLRAAGYERVKINQYHAPVESGLCDISLSQYEDFEVLQVMFLNCSAQGVTMGDLAGVLGNPTAVGRRDPSLSGYDLGVPFAPSLIFDDNEVLQTVRYIPKSLFDNLNYIMFYLVHDEIRIVDWRNFNDYTFCRINPAESICP